MHDTDLSEPVCIVISDQNFPAALRVHSGQCVVILRVEDGLLSELASVFREFMCDEQGECLLVEGSVILCSSLSHLSQRGLGEYTEQLVQLFGNMCRIVGAVVSVVHGLSVPIG